VENNYTAQRLPCLNPSQISAKLITKGQQSLEVSTILTYGNTEMSSNVL
ncbi:hypothetical protein EV690_0001, partial [Celerinatantimonas diazotrophica]